MSHIKLLFFSVYEPKSGISGSYATHVLNILRNLHAAFRSGCTHLHPHQECRKIPFCLQPLQYLFLVDLSDDGHSDHGEAIFQCCFDLH